MANFSGLNFREYPHKNVQKYGTMVQYLHFRILKFPLSYCWHRQVTAAFGRLLGTWAKRQLLGASAAGSAVPVEWMPNLGRLGKVENGGGKPWIISHRNRW